MDCEWDYESDLDSTEEMQKNMEKKKETHFLSIGNFRFREFLVTTAIPFVIPFIKEIPKQYIHDLLKIIIMSVALIIDMAFIYKLYKQRNTEEYESWSSGITRDAYSNAYELNEKKRDYLKSKSYDSAFFIPGSAIPYNVRDYIGEICKNFGGTIAKITGIAKEYVSVSFIYHYIYTDASEEDLKWRWIIGKESNTRIDLNEFVSRKRTLYRYMLSDPYGKKLNIVFCNDKRSLAHEHHYHISIRDGDHSANGSVFAARITFGNNSTSFVEGIMIVSTYGKRFIQRKGSGFSSRQLKNVIVEEIFPFYQRLLETELGVLYLRHLSENESETKE